MLQNINQAIIWAAGFLEGDGSFVLTENKGIKVQASQVNMEPIADLMVWFNGTVYHSECDHNKNGLYQWVLTRHDAAALMMTVYSLMSERRKTQIRKCLKVWKTVSLRRTSETHCVKGHLLSGGNVSWSTHKGGDRYKLCLRCQRERRKERHERSKKSCHA